MLRIRYKQDFEAPSKIDFGRRASRVCNYA